MLEMPSSLEGNGDNVTSPRRTILNVGSVEDSTDQSVSAGTPVVGVSAVTADNTQSDRPAPTPAQDDPDADIARALVRMILDSEGDPEACRAAIAAALEMVREREMGVEVAL